MHAYIYIIYCRGGGAGGWVNEMGQGLGLRAGVYNCTGGLGRVWVEGGGGWGCWRV